MEQQINRPAMNAAHLPWAIHFMVAFGSAAVPGALQRPLDGQDG